jgi:hypothetical protein
MYSNKNSIYCINALQIHFLKIPLPIMNKLVFNFQNMMDMHKGYAYQNFNSITYQKKLIRVQPSLLEQNQHEQNPKQSNM